MERADTPTALGGVLVADFSRVLAGPLATMILGDLGANVVKVERPGRGDDTRSWGPPYLDGESAYYLAINRNKRSIAVDLSTADGRAVARRLAERADVLVENFKSGTMERLGLSSWVGDGLEIRLNGARAGLDDALADGDALDLSLLEPVE